MFPALSFLTGRFDCPPPALDSLANGRIMFMTRQKKPGGVARFRREQKGFQEIR
jgi:hypothetical protein